MATGAPIAEAHEESGLIRTSISAKVASAMRVGVAKAEGRENEQAEDTPEASLAVEQMVRSVSQVEGISVQDAHICRAEAPPVEDTDATSDAKGTAGYARGGESREGNTAKESTAANAMPAAGAAPLILVNRPSARRGSRGKGQRRGIATARKSGGGTSATGGSAAAETAAKKDKCPDQGEVAASGLAKQGSGKRARAGQGYDRGRREETTAVHAPNLGLVDVSPDIKTLWTSCARQHAPIKKSDEACLVDEQRKILALWGVHPDAARELAERYRGSWLHPSMSPEQLLAGLTEMSPFLQRPPIVSLGRPYRDVYKEEDFNAELETFAEGPQVMPSMTSTASSAGGLAGIPDGERRSQRSCGRRSSCFATGGGGASSAGGGGGGGSGGSDGRGRGRGRSGVIFPCEECRASVSDWSKVVPTHDEARFRLALDAARLRLPVESTWGRVTAQHTGDVSIRARYQALLQQQQQQQQQQQSKTEGGAPDAERKQDDARGRAVGTRPEELKVSEDSRGTTVRGEASPRPRRPSDRATREQMSLACSLVASSATTKEGTHATVPTPAKDETGLAPVWVGSEANSLCHPVFPPRQFARQSSAAALKEAAEAHHACKESCSSKIPAALAAAYAVGNPNGCLDPRGPAGADTRNEGVRQSVASSDSIGGSASSIKRSSGRLRELEQARSEVSGREQPELASKAESLQGRMDEDQEDEVWRQIVAVWEKTKTVEAKVLHALGELEGLSRQERCVQPVLERANDAHDALSDALILSQLSKIPEPASKPYVGLAEDFPYHDPTERPVIEARRMEMEAAQSSQWLHEEMVGCSMQEVEEAKAQREKKRDILELAERTERMWRSQRLAAGRHGQKGRGRGLPIPGGVAHPFLVDRESADFLYSLDLDQEVEARDEWGVWCRGKIVAVRGDGGWVPERGDTNVLRAVKISFHGWGAAMDTWLPVDNGMIAKPGTHLPPTAAAEAAAAAQRPRQSEPASTPAGLAMSRDPPQPSRLGIKIRLGQAAACVNGHPQVPTVPAVPPFSSSGSGVTQRAGGTAAEGTADRHAGMKRNRPPDDEHGGRRVSGAERSDSVSLAGPTKDSKKGGTAGIRVASGGTADTCDARGYKKRARVETGVGGSASDTAHRLRKENGSDTCTKGAVTHDESRSRSRGCGISDSGGSSLPNGTSPIEDSRSQAEQAAHGSSSATRGGQQQQQQLHDRARRAVDDETRPSVEKSTPSRTPSPSPPPLPVPLTVLPARGLGTPNGSSHIPAPSSAAKSSKRVDGISTPSSSTDGNKTCKRWTHIGVVQCRDRGGGDGGGETSERKSLRPKLRGNAGSSPCESVSSTSAPLSPSSLPSEPALQNGASSTSSSNLLVHASPRESVSDTTSPRPMMPSPPSMTLQTPAAAAATAAGVAAAAARSIAARSPPRGGAVAPIAARNSFEPMGVEDVTGNQSDEPIDVEEMNAPTAPCTFPEAPPSDAAASTITVASGLLHDGKLMTAPTTTKDAQAPIGAALVANVSANGRGGLKVMLRRG